MSATTIYWGHCAKCGAVIYGSGEMPSYSPDADQKYIELHEKWHERLDERINAAAAVGARGDLANTLMA